MHGATSPFCIASACREKGGVGLAQVLRLLRSLLGERLAEFYDEEGEARLGRGKFPPEASVSRLGLWR